MTTMEDDIRRELAIMEAAKGVSVLLAVESGSRCWGFASPDSDYDVRIVYVCPLSDYLRLGTRRDTVEWRLDETYDVAGWDLFKFLRLLRASNPSALEWLMSPIVYEEAPEFSAVRGLLPDCHNPVASAHHYLNMARANKAALEGESIKLKKNLYVTRALLATRWVVRVGTPVPMEFRYLCDAMLEPGMRQLMDEVVAEKMLGDEKAPHARIPQLDAWIATTAGELEEAVKVVEPKAKLPWERFDEVFQGIVCGQVSRR